MVFQNRISSDFDLILAPHFESFSDTGGYKSSFVFMVGSMSFSTPIFNLKSGHSGLLKLGFRMEGIAKTTLPQKSFFF